MMPKSLVLEKLREFCLSFLETYETLFFEYPCFKIREKTFACYEMYNEQFVVTFKTSLAKQNYLVQSCQGYFVAPYVGCYGWVCLYKTLIQWETLKSMLKNSYCF